MTQPRILVAGIGNIFMGDDAFGVEVAQRLATRQMPDDVQVVDFGIRGFDLAYALMDDYEAVVLVDALPRGGEPGTLYVIEPDLEAINESTDADVVPHGMDPVQVLRMVASLGGQPRSVLVVGCEPATTEADVDEGRMGLSDPVQAAMDEAVKLVESVVADLRSGRTLGQTKA